jgi:hypothetical protein
MRFWIVRASIVILFLGSTRMALRAGLPTDVPSLTVTADGRVAILNPRNGLVTIGSDRGIEPVWQAPFDFRASRVTAAGSAILAFCVSKERGEPALWTVQGAKGSTQRLSLPDEVRKQIVTGAAASPDGRSLYLVTTRRTLIRLELGRGPGLVADPPIYLELTPGAVAAGNAGLIVVADAEAPFVSIVGPKGPARRFAIEQPIITSMSVSGDGRFVLLVTPVFRGVLRLDLNSGRVSPIGTLGFEPGGVAAAPDGSIWVIDLGGSQLARLDESGNVLKVQSLPRGLAKS